MVTHNLFILKLLQKRLWITFFLFLTFLFLGIGVLFFKYKNEEVFFFRSLNEEKTSKKRLEPFDKLFNARDLSISPSFSPLSKELKMGVYEPRPDKKAQKPCLEIRFKEEKQGKIVAQDEIIYLKYDNGYKIWPQKTDFYLIPKVIQTNLIKILLRAEYFDLDHKKRVKEEFLEIKPELQVGMEMDVAFEKEVSFFKNAIWLGPDLFLDLYKRKETQGKDRLIFSSYDINYVKPNDFFIFKDNKWVKAELSQAEGYSLAQIRSITNKGLEVDLWPKQGPFKQTIRLAKVLPSSTLRANEDFISEIYIRTKKQISCKIEGQRVIVKEGAILCKKQGKWRKGTLEIIENQEDITEFFVFDNLETKEGEQLIRAYLFNRDKTQVVKFEKRIKNLKKTLKRVRR